MVIKKEKSNPNSNSIDFSTEMTLKYSTTIYKGKEGELAPDTLCSLLLWGIWDNFIELKEMMGGGDVSEKYYDAIIELSWRYYGGTSMTRKGSRWILMRIGKTTSNRITRVEIGMLKDFKTNILSSMSSKLDTLHMNKKPREKHN